MHQDPDLLNKNSTFSVSSDPKSMELSQETSSQIILCHLLFKDQVSVFFSH